MFAISGHSSQVAKDYYVKKRMLEQVQHAENICAPIATLMQTAHATQIPLDNPSVMPPLCHVEDGNEDDDDAHISGSKGKLYFET